ncbi:hypothetical protein V8C86DRAFT_2465519, partial [Haematococcus lacustris]
CCTTAAAALFPLKFKPGSGQSGLNMLDMGRPGVQRVRGCRGWLTAGWLMAGWLAGWLIDGWLLAGWLLAGWLTDGWLMEVALRRAWCNAPQYQLGAAGLEGGVGCWTPITMLAVLFCHGRQELPADRLWLQQQNRMAQAGWPVLLLLNQHLKLDVDVSCSRRAGQWGWQGVERLEVAQLYVFSACRGSRDRPKCRHRDT